MIGALRRGSCCGIRVHEAMFARVVNDRRIFADGNRTNAGLAFKNGPRNTGRSGGGRETAGKRIARRRFQRLPFLSRRQGRSRLAQTFCSHRGENAMFQILRCLAFLIERMHGHDADFAVVANEDRGDRVIEGTRWMNHRREPSSWAHASRVAVKSRRGIKPAAATTIKEPAAVMIGRPAPRLRANPGPAKTRIVDPLPGCERRPANSRTKRPPAVSVTAAIQEGSVRVEVRKS